MRPALADLDTALLRTFAVLAATRSFSRTGAQVGRSQSAVSSQIARLESAFGRRLLDRNTRSVRLTADGEQLLHHARQVLGAADALAAAFSAPDVAGEVRFASPEDFASAHMPAVLAAFAAAHPGVRLHVECDLTLPLIEQLEAGRHDLVIVKQDPAALHPGCRPLWEEQLVWAAAPGRTRPRFAPLAEAARHGGPPLQLVCAPAPCVYRRRATMALDAAGIPWRVVYASPSHAGCVAAVRAGLGVAVMPRSQVPGDLQAVDAKLGWPPLAPAALCLLGAAAMPAAAQALAAFIAAQAPAMRGVKKRGARTKKKAGPRRAGPPS